MKAIVLASYSPAALRGLMGGSDRRAAIESMLQPVEGTVERIAFVRGEYDILVSATTISGGPSLNVFVSNCFANGGETGFTNSTLKSLNYS